MPYSTLASIFSSSPELVFPQRISGAPLSAQALLVAKSLSRRSGLTQKRARPSGPLIVICPNDDIAQEFCRDLDCWNVNSTYFPGWEQSPYSSIAPSLRTRFQRISILSRLNSAMAERSDGETSSSTFQKPFSVITTTLAATCQATLPKSFLHDNTLLVRVGESVQSREALVEHLIQSGYLRIDPVEDPGTFSVRGDLVDVFPPQRGSPIRIELFDDVVEKIREFDPVNQRTLAAEQSSLPEVRLAPCREVLINIETSEELRKRLKARADEIGIPRPKRDPILASIREGTYPDHSDFWAPLTYEEPATFWDHLPEDYSVVWIDEWGTRQEWEEFMAEQIKRDQNAAQNDHIIPAVDRLYLFNEKLGNLLREHTFLYLDRVDLSNPLTGGTKNSGSEHTVSQHPVFIEQNVDFKLGSHHSLGDIEVQLRQWLKEGFKTWVFASTQSQLERIRFLLEERHLPCRELPAADLNHDFHPAGTDSGPSVICLVVGALSEGWRWTAEGLVVLTDSEILGTRHVKPKSDTKTDSAAKNWAGVQALSDLAIGDIIVHVDHGLGKYQGLVRLNLSGAPNDFLLLEYANKDKLYLPIYRLNVVQKYSGVGSSVILDRLGSQQFEKAKESVKSAVQRLAFDLVDLYAERALEKGLLFSPPDAAYREFEANFPFSETPDQLKAIEAVSTDLQSGKIMDRIVCGDVGYGKTEVAIRAAYRAVSEGKQVAVLVPTTILAYQHEQSFKARLKNYPLLIDSLSRFKTAKEQRAIIEATQAGKVDIVIGTHRLLSKDVEFHDLGLIIVDEEHRFGVEHKEKLKRIKLNTHVLTLTATPIPRTLHMALSGLRDISLINTPPLNRLPIKTYVSQYEDEIAQKAIDFEMARGGQVFYLHNRVSTIEKTAKHLQTLNPKARIIIGHGQMTEAALEKQMIAFYEKKADVFVCTTIIESGIDLPSANTILIDRADQLGLAQLYQIRGRVGRGEQRAYAYLFIPPSGHVTGDARKRLEVIQRFVELGSGFNIASHDLEIRGGGDLLGAQQSGHIAAVGFDLYTELLEEAIRAIQGRPVLPEDSRLEPEIKIPFPAFLSEEYIPDVHQRLSIYRRFSATRAEPEIDRLEEELQDRFGPPPTEGQNFFWLIRIKLLLKKRGIQTLTVGPEKVSLVPSTSTPFNPVRIIALISAYPEKYQLTPDSKLIAQAPTQNMRDLFFGLESLFREFE